MYRPVCVVDCLQNFYEKWRQTRLWRYCGPPNAENAVEWRASGEVLPLYCLTPYSREENDQTSRSEIR